MGLIRLDNGDLVAFALCITDSKESTDDNYDITSEIGAAIYLYFADM